MSHMITPVELTDLELDAVAGGSHGSLVDVDVNVEDNVITVDIPVDIEVRNVRVNIAALNAGPITQA